MINVKRDIRDLVGVDRASPISLAVQIHQQLSWLIASRVVEEGQALPAIRALAESLGVNLHTVRAAYQHLERDGMVEMRPGRGTTVLPADTWRTFGAESTLPTSTIGVIIPTHASPFYGPFLSGVEVGTPGTTLTFVCDAHENPELGMRYLSQLVAKRVDGVIVAGPLLPPEVVDQRVGIGPPLVCADFPGVAGPGVDLDLDGASRSATEHLIEHGHERIGLITPPVTLANVRPRVDGYRRTLAESGLPGGDDLVAQVGDWSSVSGSRGFEMLLQLDDPPTAVVTVSDSLAIGAMRAGRFAGVAVPDDVAIVSIDDTGSGEFMTPPLTSVDLSPYELGRAAVEMLGDLITGRPVDQERRVLPSELVVRQSCGTH